MESATAEQAPTHSATLCLAPEVWISICGATLDDWRVHLWLQRLPTPALAEGSLSHQSPDLHNAYLQIPAEVADPQGVHCLALNLELPAAEHAQHWYEHLSRFQWIFDPDPARAALLQALGLPVAWLNPATLPSGWLNPTPELPSAWGQHLGLAKPSTVACLALGDAGPSWEHDLAAWEAQPNGPPATIHYLPQLPVLQPTSVVDARLLAAWLWASSQASEAVVSLSEHGFSVESALSCLRGGGLRRLSPPISPEELLAELRGTPVAAAWDPSPTDTDLVMDFGNGQSPEAAVLISLFNYGSTIERALDSVAAQTTQSLELIVVDDASNDCGLARVQSWMERYRHRFVRVQVLQHRHNAGLAAARNTAFANCSAAWAFVLDADNELFPGAIAACLDLSKDADSRAAVIHPLVEVIAESPELHGERSLVSRCSWQKQAFLHGNVIDAMAFVRCCAWRDVGGYTHIEGGWEDFDFWCKLMETGWHGLLCSRVLARYHAHGASMTASSTVRRWRPLSRCLQSRHSWLELPYARSGPSEAYP